MNGKLSKVRTFLEECGAAGVLVESQPNFHWLTGGRGFIGLNSETACAAVLVTRDNAWLVSNNIEGRRLLAEELENELPLLEFPWHDEKQRDELIEKHCPGQPVRDGAHAGRFMAMRTALGAEQIDIYRTIGPKIAGVLEESLLALKKGETELGLAGTLSDGLWREKVEPVTILIGFDDRLSRWRHLLPTGATFDRRAVASLAVRHRGLFVSVTRHVCRGEIPEEILIKHQAVNRVNAAMINATKPGVTMCGMFDVAMNAYAQHGFPDEWRNHHQGGLTGYASREAKAYPGIGLEVGVNQAFAWNPTIAGVKSEETVLLLANGPEIVTRTDKWGCEDYEGVRLTRIGSI